MEKKKVEEKGFGATCKGLHGPNKSSPRENHLVPRDALLCADGNADGDNTNNNNNNKVKHETDSVGGALSGIFGLRPAEDRLIFTAARLFPRLSAKQGNQVLLGLHARDRCVGRRGLRIQSQRQFGERKRTLRTLDEEV